MTKRLFVAIDLPESTRQALANLDPDLATVRWTAQDQLHLTLGFFGAVPDDMQSALDQKLSEIRFGGFFLPIMGLGAFPSIRQPKIIWVGVGTAHPHLFQIHKRVQESALAVGLEPDLRPWKPHVTLGRCQDGDPAIVKFLRDNEGFDAGLVRVDAFHLYSSKLTPAGSIHTRELTVPSSARTAAD